MQKLIEKFAWLHDHKVALLGHLRSPLLLAIRLYWGWSFFQTGWGKLTHHEKITGFFTSLNIPAPGLNAWVAGAVECFGGLLLFAGLGTRTVCFPLIFTMLVAYATAEREALVSAEKFTEAAPFLFLYACVIVMIFGPGDFSIDHLIARWWEKKHSSPKPAA
jgi:putative oxidoreductase